jgi:hypothetical protein
MGGQGQPREPGGGRPGRTRRRPVRIEGVDGGVGQAQRSVRQEAQGHRPTGGQRDGPRLTVHRQGQPLQGHAHVGRSVRQNGVHAHAAVQAQGGVDALDLGRALRRAAGGHVRLLLDRASEGEDEGVAARLPLPHDQAQTQGVVRWGAPAHRRGRPGVRRGEEGEEDGEQDGDSGAAPGPGGHPHGRDAERHPPAPSGAQAVVEALERVPSS